MTTTQITTIDQPGVYDLDAEAYHADPVPGRSLSHSGVKELLDCPARFHYWQDHPRKPKREFDFGHAAHKEVLGKGEVIEVVDAADWRTKAAKEKRDEAYATGRSPILAHEYEATQAMVAKIREHHITGPLLEPGTGKAEQSLFWQDEQTGIWRRAMLDWMTWSANDRLLVVDYKSASSAHPESFSKDLVNFGYGTQGPYYLDGVQALDLDCGIEPAFLFVVQEKEPPYLITVGQPDPDAMAWGRARNRRAINTYVQCTESGIWPAYTEDVVSLSLPRWVPYEESQ